jgi:hypothetical protein
VSPDLSLLAQFPQQFLETSAPGPVTRPELGMVAQKIKKKKKILISIVNFSKKVFFFMAWGFELKTLKQVLYHLTHTSSLF